MNTNSIAKSLRPILCGALAATLLGLAPVAARAADDAEALLRKLEKLPAAERTKKLIAGAKKEGKVIWYTTDGPRPTQIILKAFSKKYPFVKAEFIRAKSRAILDRITTEARAGRNLFDIAKTSTETYDFYPEREVFAVYNSPAKTEIPAAMRGDRWASLFSFVRAMAYNTTMVKKADLPRSWEDLLDPKWKGKILFDHSSLPEVATLYSRWGKEKTTAFLTKLGASGNLQLRRGRTTISQLVSAGEAPLGVTIYPYNIEGLKAKGATIDWALLDPTPGLLQPTSIARHAPHPYSAALLYDYLMSREGQKVYAKMRRIPANPNVDAKVARMKASVSDPRVVFDRPGPGGPPSKEIANLLDQKILKKSFRK
jgi:iron(III) transport system substrate-binding protein